MTGIEESPLLAALELTAAEYRDRYRMGPQPWYVVLPSRYEQRGSEVVAGWERIYYAAVLGEPGNEGWPRDLVGVEFAAGRNDPRPPQLRRITFPFLNREKAS